MNLSQFFTKRRTVLASLLFVILLSITALFFSSRDARSFEQLTSQFFVSELTGNTLNMHYTIASPSSYGITSYTPRYGLDFQQARANE